MFAGRSDRIPFTRGATLFFMMLWLALGAAFFPVQGWAFQEAEAPAAAPAEAAADAAPAPAADAADAADAAPTTDTSATEAPAEERSFLMWMIDASGAWGAILLLISFLMVAIIMINLLQVRRENLLPEGFVAAFEEKLTAKDYQGAYEIARADESLIARLLAAGLGRLNRGYDEALEGMQEVGEEENMALEHRLSYLAMIASVAPMIGLMGTVWGMIASFRIIASSATAPKPKELAEGISTALFTTLEGLVVAIPAMIAYGLLRNRVARLFLEVGRVSEGLMSRFSTVGKTEKS